MHSERESFVKAALPLRDRTVHLPFPSRRQAVAGIALNLLGPPSLAVHGSPVAGVGSSKCLALLTYLALEAGPHSREELAALLWGDSPESAARASLRQALKRLRKALGDVMHVDRTCVELSGPVDCDVSAFLESVDTRPEEAAGFDVPRFLSGFSPQHAPAFEEWAATKRQQLLQRFRQVLGTLAGAAIAQSHWREAVVWADRWLACDPLSDEATRLAMEALYLAGDRGAALARFAEYRDRIAREVGSKPSAALLELERRIAAEVAASRPVVDRSEAPVPSFEGTLVGREEQWRKLSELWSAVRRGAGRVALIEGEPGIGKTRLAEEFLRWAGAEGATVLRGRGYDAKTGIPFGPVVEILRGSLQAPGLGGAAPEWLAEVTRLLPELRQRFPGLPEPAAPSDTGRRWRLFEGIAQLVLAVAAERPTVLFVDDLQWCDSETCALLHFLARRLEGVRVALVATLTQGELERDAPAARLSRALRSQPDAAVVSLPPLSEDDVWRLIHELGRLRSPASGRRFASRLREVTDGNPFHLIELLKTLFAEGLLTVEPNTGEWLASPEVGSGDAQELLMPRTVHSVIWERVASLPYELRDLLVAIAVAGRGVKTDLLSHVHAMSRLRAAALCDALVERRLLVQEAGVYRCAHPVIAEVVRESLTGARRRELHRVIALSLETITPSERIDEVAGEITRHAERGGERTMAYRYAMLASEAAARHYAFEEALSWLDLAATVAVEGAETDAVNRRTADVLRLAGWTDPTRSTRRPGTPARGIERGDLDLGLHETGGRA